ncbi:MAG: hypothetical protein KDB25_05265 [Leucobacter sp.]|nr:hypothetical protein [Leucobacter sp.]
MRRLLVAGMSALSLVIGLGIPYGVISPALAAPAGETQGADAPPASGSGDQSAASDTGQPAGGDLAAGESSTGDASTGGSGGGDDTAGDSAAEGTDAGTPSAEPEAEQPAKSKDELQAAATPPIVAFAAPNNNYCTVPGTYALDADRYVWNFPVTGGTSTTTGQFSAPGSLKGSINGLAITPDGTAAYAVGYRENWTWSRDRYEIQRLAANASTSTTVINSPNLNNVANDDAVMVGAIDPTGTYYYFGHFTGTNPARLELWAANISTNAWIGQVARINFGNLSYTGTEGDIAFDADGKLLVLWNRGGNNNTPSRVFRIDDPIPTTPGTGSLASTQMGTPAQTNNYPWTGLALDSSGSMWLGRARSGTQSYREELVFPNTLQNGGNVTTAFVVNDLASCGPMPWNVTLRKNIVSRVNPGDQFKLDIRDGDDASLATATTIGGITGLQSAIAGPVTIGSPTGTKIAEVGANGANIAGYTSTYGCAWEGGGTFVAPGTALPHSFDTGRTEIELGALPNDHRGDTLVCTITNTAKSEVERAPKIVVEKKLGSNRSANSNQFTVSLWEQGGASALTSTTTTGSGSTVNNGTTSPQPAEAGVGYVIAEAASGTTNLANYTKAYACVWTDGSVLASGSLTVGASGRAQAALPVFAPDDKVSQTLTCTITNTVLTASTPLCTTGFAYAVNGSGQMLQINPSGVVSNIGTASGVDFNSLGIGANGSSAYAVYRDPSNAYQGRVYAYNISTGAWARISGGGGWDFSIGTGAIVAGAVSPITGTYYAGGFTTPAGDFILKSLNADGTAMVDNGYLDLDSYDNGDIAFDSMGNMYLVRGKNATDFRRTTIYRVEAADLAAAAGTNNSIPFTTVMSETILTGMASGAAVNGTGFSTTGHLLLSTATALYDLALPGTTTTSIPLSGLGLSGSSDLATCTYPPTVSLRKELPGGRVAPADRFGLTLYRNGTVQNPGTNNATISAGIMLGNTTAQSPASGIQTQMVNSVGVVSGQTISFAETYTNGASGSDYVSGYVCTANDEPLSPAVSGSGSAGQFTVPTFASSTDIVCTFRNTFLHVSKTASPASGTQMSPDGVITYTLTFDNTDGTGAAAVTHRDHLSDVLDDAYFINAGGTQVASPVFTYSNPGGGTVSATWVPGSSWVNISGNVAAGQTSTVTFRVKVKPNQTDALDREDATGGYLLRNYLTKNSVTTPPTSCVVEPGDDPLCTEHPVNAWKIEKSSLPADIARLHVGGNVFYKIEATRQTPGTEIKDLVLTDDLTHVFKTAGFAPDAVAPNGARNLGLYLFDEDGQTLKLDGTQTAAQPDKARALGVPELDVNGRWILTSGAPFDVPANAVRVEMWISVQAGERPAFADHPFGLVYGDPDPWSAPNEPKTGYKFVNYATADGKDGESNDLPPNLCITGVDVPDVSLSPTSANPEDPDFPDRCSVRQELSGNFFTIRKDAGGAGVAHLANDSNWDPDPSGLWNMIGHEFEIRDDVSGSPSSYPSVKLCRTDYDPYNGWDGTWISPANAADDTRWDWAQSSDTLDKIVQWNNEHPVAADQLPLCGLLYPIASGPQEGRWRSENLGSADDTTPGQYWLVETKAPDAQAKTDATQGTRPVPGVQLLAEPIAFQIWPDDDGPTAPGSGGAGQHGRGQLDVTGEANRCDPASGVSARPIACVNPTGYLMLVKDPTPIRLPLTGGVWLGILTAGGGVVFIAALVGIWYWRRRRTQTPRTPGGGAH